MNVKTTKLSTVMIISLLLFTMTANICSAQEWSRKGKSELFGTLEMMGSETVEYSYHEDLHQLPVTFDMDSTILYGIAFGYNFSDNWNINTNVLFGSADTDVKVAGTKVDSADMDYVRWDVNIDYNIWKSRFTPLVTCGIGFMDFGIDTTTYEGDVHESNFSTNLGAGVRWDIKDDFLLKLVYRSTWTELQDSDNDQRYDSVSLSAAFMF